MGGKAAPSLARTARTACAGALFGALTLFGTPAHATATYGTEWELDVDARLLTSNGEKSFFDGGFGTLRFDQYDSGLQLGRIRLALDQNLGEVWSAHLDASSFGNDDQNPLDLTEAYLQFRPYPFDGFRARLKAGAFYAPISLENRSAGWESPYTLSSSAINTWVAEELRTIGLEGQIDWLGTRTGHVFDLALTGALFGWNDPAGVVLARNGFMLNDRQSTLFGRVGQFGGPPPAQAPEVFHEIDGRPGAYAGVEARYLDRIVFRVLRYDNRGDPTEFDPSAHEYAWLTRFTTAGLRAESAGGWTGIAQWLDGETFVEPKGAPLLGWGFRSKFLLLSKRTGRHTVSVRYDTFDVGSHQARSDDGTQYGHAWTAAYLFEPSPKWKFTLEWLSVASDSDDRADYGSLAVRGVDGILHEHKLEAAFRYAIGSAVK
jgi:hypothetical protein